MLSVSFVKAASKAVPRFAERTLSHVKGTATAQEVRSMLRARKSGVLTPCIFYVEHEAATIYMERIEGQTVRDILLSSTLSTAGDPPVHLKHVSQLLVHVHA